jgi:hypothetical protein
VVAAGAAAAAETVGLVAAGLLAGADVEAGAVVGGAGATVGAAVVADGPQPSDDSSIAVDATPPVMCSTRRIMSRRER